MRQEPKQETSDEPHEPMPESYRPVWVFLGYMVLIMVVMGVVAMIIAMAVR